ncbi:MAG: helix-turn-helix domain-containing protein [Candidatus Saccharibacteria bacterium]|nr:helix-turn-helix domain-containing protein [Microbacteriaceae bacterium]
MRAASAELNLHHSSLAHRLKNVEKKLQVDLTDSPTVFMLTVALQLYRIAGWA